MANEKLLALVKKGRGAFVKWRKRHPKVVLDLMDADLAEADLRSVNLRRADMIGINLTGANLTAATLTGADLTRSKLPGANLQRADLSQALFSFADLRNADLTGANLKGADLSRAELTGAVLREANLEGAKLCEAGLSEADLSGASLKNADLTGGHLIDANLSRVDFSEALLNEARLDRADLTDAILNRAELQSASLTQSRFGWTSLGNIDLSQAQGLDSVVHLAPSSLGIDSLCRSKGKLPEVFQRGCGVPAGWIEQTTTLATESPASPVCFLSFSEDDRPIAELLQNALGEQGIRCWLHGKPKEKTVGISNLFERHLSVWDKLLLCASSNSLRSWWVDDEITAALEREETLAEKRGVQTHVLVPIIVDGYIQGGNWQGAHTKQLYERLTIDFSKCRRDKKRFDAEIEKTVRVIQDDGETDKKSGKRKK